MLKFIHAADIHLDSPRGGLERDESVPAEEIRHAPRRALENLVRLALEEKVDFVLIAGDLYDGDWKDFRTGLFFVGQMQRLREAGIPVFLIAGNHDAANKMTKSLALPENVRFLSEKKPETIEIEKLGVAIHGQGFAKQAVVDDLSAAYPAPIAGPFNIGMLHTCATKSGEHERYAPCTLDGLRAKQYQYWALGHIHKRETLCDDPHIVFPGNLQGRHIRETGPKGCVVVTVDDREQTSIAFHPLDVFRWERCTVDAAGADTAADVVGRVAVRLRELLQQNGDLPLAVRIELCGPTRAHRQLVADPRRWHAEIQSQAMQVGDGRLWIERVERRTLPPADRDELFAADGPLAELSAYLDDLAVDEAGLLELAAELKTLEDRLPRELVEQADGALTDPARVRGWLGEVREILIHRLANRGGAE